MNGSLLIFLLLAPFLFWAAYHYYHDRHRPEPIANLVICIGLGAAAAYLNQYMYISLDYLGLRFDASQLAQENLPGLFVYAVLGIGVTEETAKMLLFLLFVQRFAAFDEPMDGIVYGSFMALGFSLIENIHFLQFQLPGEAIARSFAGPLVHIVFTSVWAYHIGLTRLQGGRVWLSALGWLAVAALLHGIYDFIVLGFSSTALVFSALVIVAVWLWRLSVIRRLNAGAQSTPSVP